MPHRDPSLLAAPTRAKGRVWLTNARLFDATGGEARGGAAVLLSDGVIERVARAQDAVPDGAQGIDLEGRMLLPGLINLHVHTQAAELHPEHGAEPILTGTAAHFLQAGLRKTLAMASRPSGTSEVKASSRRKLARRCATERSAGPGC